MTDATAGTASPNRRAPRWMKVALVVSVAINLLVVGLAAGAIWHFRYSFAMHGGVPHGFGHYAATLPAERRDKIDALLREERDIITPLRRRARSARRAAVEIFTADTLDREALAKAQRELMEARTELTRARMDLFPRIAELLTAEERREFLRWNKRRRHGRWRHHD